MIFFHTRSYLINNFRIFFVFEDNAIANDFFPISAIKMDFYIELFHEFVSVHSPVDKCA